MTTTTLKKNQEINALKREHVIERNDTIKKFEGFEAMIKFVLKKNTDLDENDIEEMMSRTLGNESSAIASCSFVATHVPDDDNNCCNWDHDGDDDPKEKTKVILKYGKRCRHHSLLWKTMENPKIR